MSTACRQVKADAPAAYYDPDTQFARFWGSLKARVEQIVCESNSLACERLWNIATDPARTALRVCASGDAADCVEIRLDQGTSMLRCDFGPSTGWSRTAFQLIPSGPSIGLRLGDADLTLDETLDVILNRLTFPEA